MSKYFLNNFGRAKLSASELMEIAMAAGLPVEVNMKANIRAVDFVDTGETLNSTQVRPFRATDSNAEVHIGPTTDYALYGEFGTMNMAARPFARPAADESHEAIGRAVAQALAGRLR